MKVQRIFQDSNLEIVRSWIEKSIKQVPIEQVGAQWIIHWTNEQT